MQTEFSITEDGSHTLYVPEIDECYHSSHGAIQESEHIFIEAALNQCSKKEITVFEVGFGTGLNAYLASLWAEKKGLKLKYITIEKYPIQLEAAINLNFPEILNESSRNLEALHQAPWNKLIRIHGNFDLIKIEADYCNFQHKEKYDIVFFDAFSPEKQAEMWSAAQFEKLYKYCKPGAIMTTYCAKGVVRRTMQNAGFAVERLAGPPGKREILRASKK